MFPGEKSVNSHQVVSFTKYCRDRTKEFLFYDRSFDRLENRRNIIIFKNSISAAQKNHKDHPFNAVYRNNRCLLRE
jgi:hypothetical protein